MLKLLYLTLHKAFLGGRRNFVTLISLRKLECYYILYVQNSSRTCSTDIKHWGNGRDMW